MRKQLAIAFSVLLLLTSCAAQSNQPTTVHVDGTPDSLEHDQVITPKGTADFYPSEASPREISFTDRNGSTSYATCIDSTCSSLLLKIKDSAILPNGSLRVFQTQDPNIFEVRAAEGPAVLGYVAKDHGGTWKFLPDLEQAQTYAFHNETTVAGTVGNVFLGILAVVVLLAVLGLSSPVTGLH
jgi:hypothetical protein